MDPLRAPLVKLDPPVMPSEVRAPRPLKLKPQPPKEHGAAAKRQKAEEAGVPVLEDILNAILPAREVEDKNGQQLLQFVSAQPATRLDVIHLQEQLDNRLIQRRARETGLCAVRSELYSDTFDELIRQVTINSPERGLVLLRVRDELRMTLAAHRALYHEAQAFGVQKAMIAEQGLPEMRERISQLEREKAALEVRVQELQARCENIEKREQEARVEEEKKHAREVDFYRRTNHQLTSHFKQESERANTKK